MASGPIYDTVHVQIELVEDPSEFAAKAGTFISSDPFTTNVIAVVAARTIAGSLLPSPGDVWGLVVDDHGTVVGAAMANSPYNLFLSRMPTEGATLFAERLNAIEMPLPGVTGESATARAFAERWEALHSVSSVVQIAHTTYRLERLIAPTTVNGSARLATDGDGGLVADWLDMFHDEALAHDPVVDNRVLAEQRIAAREIWLWERDSRRVALSACSHPAAGVARIGPVFVPASERGNGYAAGATAAAIQAAHSMGTEHVMLYADQDNPTSNALYRRLGFVPDHEALDLGFGTSQ